MIAMAPMISAILGAVFLKEIPDKKTWLSNHYNICCSCIYFYDSVELGNFYGDIFGLITAFGLACNAVLASFAKDRDLVPSAVIGKLCVAVFALFFVESFALIERDLDNYSFNVCYVCCYTVCISNNCTKIYTC